jgi:hypothetical protein
LTADACGLQADETSRFTDEPRDHLVPELLEGQAEHEWFGDRLQRERVIGVADLEQPARSQCDAKVGRPSKLGM